MTLTKNDYMFRNIGYGFLIVTALLLVNCNPNISTTETSQDSTVSTRQILQKGKFGTLPDGREVYRYVLKNKNGVEIHVINYGGIITHLKAPDKNGVLEDIALGYDSLSGYLKETPYFGALVGRYGNRIANGKFTLEGKEYSLVQNDNGQHLHGGTIGFDKVFWDIEPLDSASSLRLTYRSKDMEEGYPGNLDVIVDYTLTENNELKIDYSATTDKATVVNLTQHTYFNLSGNGRRDILDHILTINADQYVPVTKVLIPTGQLATVKNTPFDFTSPTRVGARINVKNEQLLMGKGYDHCWVISGNADNKSLRMAATLYDSISGRTVEVMTTEPGIQFYSGNFLNGSITGKDGVVYKHRYGLCLETEHFPDSPNQPQFPSVVLKPGEKYSTQTIYRFGTK
jgi:aldose 1-epimerase